MNGNLEGFIEATQNVRNADELREHYARALHPEGYENVVFARTRNRSLVALPWTQFPSGYAEQYQAGGWEKIDPVLTAIQIARRPFHWSDAFPRDRLSPKQKKFLEECRELGVHSGVTIPLHGPGTQIDLISLSLRDHVEVSAQRLPYLYGLSVQYWLKYCDLMDRIPSDSGTTVKLTSQELECLRWCKDGKTNWEIGELLSISEKTVEFHVTNIIRKLGASNRITAVVMAIQRGLITL